MSKAWPVDDIHLPKPRLESPVGEGMINSINNRVDLASSLDPFSSMEWFCFDTGNRSPFRIWTFGHVMLPVCRGVLIVRLCRQGGMNSMPRHAVRTQ
ncbi:MAG: hypothetical protein ONB48_17585 [candidate division KSB1 bacterium]|nr:hypothetical protein [candidate division KSB1 bacterium]MDZ7275288.1 hypothetical protein [candidate division KSB1 bacterium]MDZ7287456.1 hypothetical protein [candidate division KSB1 bacterium]MDZ7299570.1 hypothetical protein [candidate division KSB1 bacterium]MDZ7307322.1 hypothetical protein [candidate division KSB1 bacterium]